MIDAAAAAAAGTIRRSYCHLLALFNAWVFIQSMNDVLDVFLYNRIYIYIDIRSSESILSSSARASL